MLPHRCTLPGAGGGGSADEAPLLEPRLEVEPRGAADEAPLLEPLLLEVEPTRHDAAMRRTAALGLRRVCGLCERKRDGVRRG